MELETARYRVGDTTALTASNTLLRNPDIVAVTLIDIIVFHHEADALGSRASWPGSGKLCPGSDN